VSEQGQPSWTVHFEGEAADAGDSRSPYVILTVEQRVEVTDLAALQSAVWALDGPPNDDVDQTMRGIPANVVGRLARPMRLLHDLPGVAGRGSSISTTTYTP